MPSLSSALKSGFITDLTVPPPNTCNLSTPHLEHLSYNTALSILHDFESFIRSNPLVQNVKRLSKDDKGYIDVVNFGKEFDVAQPSTTSRQNHPAQQQQQQATRPGEEDEDEWIQFEITDKLSILYAFSTQLVYYTAMRKTSSGFESLTNPGNGVRIHGTFDVVRSTSSSPPPPNTIPWSSTIDDEQLHAHERIASTVRPSMNIARDDDTGGAGVIHFIEKNETRCNVLLSAYIKATAGAAHREMHERFKRQWNEGMKGALGSVRGGGGV